MLWPAKKWLTGLQKELFCAGVRPDCLVVQVGAPLSALFMSSVLCNELHFHRSNATAGTRKHKHRLLTGSNFSHCRWHQRHTIQIPRMQCPCKFLQSSKLALAPGTRQGAKSCKNPAAKVQVKIKGYPDQRGKLLQQIQQCAPIYSNRADEVEARHALIKCHLFEFLQLQLSYQPLSAGSNQALGHAVACGAVGCGPQKNWGRHPVGVNFHQKWW